MGNGCHEKIVEISTPVLEVEKKGEKNLTSLFFLSALRTSCLRPSSFCKVDSIKTNNKQFSDKKRIIPQIEKQFLLSYPSLDLQG